MSCITNEPSKNSGRAFCVITGLFLVLALAILIFGLMHRSEQPQIFGRYSFSYVLLLLGIAAAVIYFSWVFTFCLKIYPFILCTRKVGKRLNSPTRSDPV